MHIFCFLTLNKVNSAKDIEIWIRYCNIDFVLTKKIYESALRIWSNSILVYLQWIVWKQLLFSLVTPGINT